MTPGPRKCGLELSGGVCSPPQVPRRNAANERAALERAPGPSAGEWATFVRVARTVPLRLSALRLLSFFVFSCSGLRRRRSAPSAPRTAGEGATGAREASEPWWRGRVTRRFVVVEEQSVVPKLICDACVSLRPAPPPPPCFAGWSPSPLSRWRMGSMALFVNKKELTMPSRKKLPEKPPYLKRRTFEEGRAQADAAHVATCRLYCDALDLWRGCAKPRCRRHRCCPRADRLFRARPASCVGKAAARGAEGGDRRRAAPHRAGNPHPMDRAPHRAQADRVVGARLNAG